MIELNTVSQTELQPAEPTRFQCRHIFTDGRRCRSASLRAEQFCYYHHTTRRPVAAPTTKRRARAAAFTLPANLGDNDRTAIQHAIAQVLHRIADNSLDPRRAGLLLYGLQIAAINLPKPVPTPAQPEHPPVEEITQHPTLGILAPVSPITPETQSLTADQQLIAQWEREDAEYLAQNLAQPAGTRAVPPPPIDLQATALASSSLQPSPATHVILTLSEVDEVSPLPQNKKGEAAEATPPCYKRITRVTSLSRHPQTPSACGCGSGAAACAAPSLQSDESVRASPGSSAQPLQACARCHPQAQSAS